MEGQKWTEIQLGWSLADFTQYICQCYPNVSLNLMGFEVARADRGKELKIIKVSSIRKLKQAVGKSRLYVVPLPEVLQVYQKLSLHWSAISVVIMFIFWIMFDVIILNGHSSLSKQFHQKQVALLLKSQDFTHRAVR